MFRKTTFFASPILRVLAALILLFSTGAAASAEPQDLDQGFGQNGNLFLDFGPGDYASEMVLQPDGKIVIAGSSILARLLPDGTLDPSFGANGVITNSQLGFNVAYRHALALQSTGKLLALGVDAASKPVIGRYTAAGNLDALFGAAGFLTPSLSPNNLAVQPDDKFIVTGSVTTAATISGTDFAVARYNSDGTPDLTFGSGGMVTTHFEIPGQVSTDPSRAFANLVAVRSDGKIVVGGMINLNPANFSAQALALVRYNADGQLDVNFGTSGKVIDTQAITADDMALGPDNELVIGGYITRDTERYSPTFTLRRYLADGQVDTDFGGPEPTTGISNVVTAPYYEAIDVEVEPDGQILAAALNYTALLLGRYNPDGSADTTIGTGGWAEAHPSGSETRAMVRQPDGKVLVFGSSVTRSSRTHPETSNFVVGRFTENGTCNSFFSDVAATDYFFEPVGWLYCRGAVSGYDDINGRNFRPYSGVTRGQLIKMAVIARGYNGDYSDRQPFSDVTTNDTFGFYIRTADAFSLVSGYADGTFRPNESVTRGQLSKIVVNAMGWAVDTTGGPHFSDVLPSNTFYGAIETAYKHSIISGYADGTFKWQNGATRGQVSKILYAAFNEPTSMTKK